MTTIISPSGQKNNEFATWDVTKKYRVGDLVVYAGKIYEANDNIPVNTPFTIGTTGATWLLAVDYTAGLPIANGTSQFNIPLADNTIEITSNGAHTWQFTDAGNLIVPGSIQSAGATDLSIECHDPSDSGLTLSLKYVDFGEQVRTSVSMEYSNVIVEATPSGGGVTHQWKFNETGNLTVPGAILPDTNITYDLGSPTQRWKDLYLSNNTIYMGDSSLSANAGNIIIDGSLSTTDSISATGNISMGLDLTIGGNFSASNVLSWDSSNSLMKISPNLESTYGYNVTSNVIFGIDQNNSGLIGYKADLSNPDNLSNSTIQLDVNSGLSHSLQSDQESYSLTTSYSGIQSSYSDGVTTSSLSATAQNITLSSGAYSLQMRLAHDGTNYTRGISIGTSASARALDSIAIGNSIGANGTRAIAIGVFSQSRNEGTIAMGVAAVSNSPAAIAIGSSSTSDGNMSVALGPASYVSGNNSIALGYYSNVGPAGAGLTAHWSVSLGANSKARGDYVTVLGANSEIVSANNSVVVGSNIVLNTSNTIQLGSSVHTVKILGNTTVVGLTANGNVSLGTVSNIRIAGGNAGQVLATDGAGNLTWTTASGGTASLPIANGTSNINIATTNGNITFGVSGNANIVKMTGNGVNVSGYLTVTGNITGNLVGNTSQQALLSSVTGEPTGFPDPSRTKTTLAFTDASRTFTIAPTGANFSVWVSGVEYIKSAAETVVVPNATQLNYISYSNTGTLQTTTTFFDLENVAPVAYVYYNTTTGTQEFFADERHGTTMDWRTHQYLHTTRGAAIATGFVGSIPTNTTGAADANAQIGISSGVFYDEDLQISVTATTTPTVNTFQQDLASPAKIPVFYRSGTAWVQDPVTSFPFKAGTARPTYNLNTGGNWTTPDITNNKYGVMFIVATNNLNYPVLSIMGQDEYASLGAAQAATYNSLDLVGMPVAEIRPLYMIIFKTANGMSNALKAAIQTYVDIRRELAVQAGSNSLTPPAGSNTEVQFNDGGVFGAAPSFTFVADTDTVTVQNLAVTGEINTSLVPSANVTYDLGSAALRWNDLYLSNNTIYMGDQTISAASGNIEFSGGITTGSVALPNGGIIEESSISGTVSATTIALKPAGGSDADQQLLVYPTAAGDLNHLHLTSGNLFNTELYLGNDDLYVKLANTGNVVINSNDGVGNSGQWTFGNDGTITLPTVATGEGISEQAVIKGQRKVIAPYHWSALISGTTPTVVYSTANNTNGLKATFMVQHSSGGFEMFEVFATKTGIDIYFTVTNRVKPPSVSDTTVTIDESAGQMLVTLTITSGASDAWVTYDATEFGIPND